MTKNGFKNKDKKVVFRTTTSRKELVRASFSKVKIVILGLLIKVFSFDYCVN